MPDRADSPHTVDRVRIRPGAGPRAATTGRRLARIAGQHLGPALAGALADVDDDLVVERVTVTFPADPDELDDQAVAMLWASLVRDSLERLRGTPPPPHPVRTMPERTDRDATDAGTPAGPDTDELAVVVGALQRWVRDGTLPTSAELELAVSRVALAQRAPAELPHPWQALARQLLDQAADAARVALPATPGTTDLQPPPVTTTGRPADPAAPGQPDPDPTGPTSHLPAVRGPAGASYQEPVAPLPAVPAGPERVGVSSWGGLVLLHYRLRPYLERAAAGEPDLDPVVVRTAALTLLVDDPAAAIDPLARLLAGQPEWGRPEWGEADDSQRLAWRDPGAAAARAEQLLRDFAGDLPGFGGSSAGFVRDQWVRRRALLLEDAPAVRITLERRPLDVVVDRLPYPIGALRLPWTPPMFVGWEKP